MNTENKEFNETKGVLGHLKSYFNNSLISAFTTWPFRIVILGWLFIKLTFDINFSYLDILNFYNSLGPSILGVTASMSGISLAAVTILLSVLNNNVLRLMGSKDLLKHFLFPFFLLPTFWGGLFLLTLLTLFHPYSIQITSLITHKVIFFNIYILGISLSILYTIFIVYTVIKTTLRVYPKSKDNIYLEDET